MAADGARRRSTVRGIVGRMSHTEEIVCCSCHQAVPPCERQGSYRFCPTCFRLSRIATSLADRARQRAKKKGIAFGLAEPELLQRLRVGTCEATGLPLDLVPSERSDAWGAWTRAMAPSIDRIDPTKGYTTENIKVVCWAYNKAKGEWSEAHRRVAEEIPPYDRYWRRR